MRPSRFFLVGLLVVLLAGSCSGGEDPGSGKTPVIIDSDGAFDDIKAILYLLEQPDLEIIALTMSGTGIAHCPAAAENTAALLERIDAPEIPVACGRTTPLEGNNQAPQMWRDSADTLGDVDLPEPRPLAGEAGELLVDTISAAEQPVMLVALGPLTNIAEAIKEDADLLDRVEMMFLMGGAVDVGGNVFYDSPGAEFNIWADPTAAAQVFATDVPITLIPLDATNDVPVTPYLYDAVAAHREASLVSEFVADYLDVTPLVGGLYHWDELAAVAATDESVVTIEERFLTITTGSGEGSGLTIEDPQGRAVRVAVAADTAIFEDHFYGAIIGTSDPGIPDWHPDAVLSWDGTTCTYEGPDPMPDELVMRFDNESDEFIAMATGIYDAGTTIDDLDAYLESGADGTPPWWKERGVVSVPPGAHDVWIVRAGRQITAICFAGSGTQLWEVAGPRLRE
jgi:inosine-uridine nucleoside N-ribohydrolase